MSCICADDTRLLTFESLLLSPSSQRQASLYMRFFYALSVLLVVYPTQSLQPYSSVVLATRILGIRPYICILCLTLRSPALCVSAVDSITQEADSDSRLGAHKPGSLQLPDGCPIECKSPSTKWMCTRVRQLLIMILQLLDAWRRRNHHLPPAMFSTSVRRDPLASLWAGARSLGSRSSDCGLIDSLLTLVAMQRPPSPPLAAGPDCCLFNTALRVQSRSVYPVWMLAKPIVTSFDSRRARISHRFIRGHFPGL